MSGDEAVTLFYQPGCSSCLRTKEFLAARKVPFRAVDVLNDPNGMAELRALGVMKVPVVSKGKRWAFGVYLDKVSELVGIEYGAKRRLSPEELYGRLDRILGAARSYIELVPEDKLKVTIPKRETRDIRDLSYHIFAVPVDFIEALDGAEYTQATAHVPDSIRGRGDLLAYADSVRRRTADWYKSQAPASWSRIFKTMWGDQTIHEVFERTTWHSGQHTRQLIAMLEMIGRPAPSPLTNADFAGLPMPERLWD